MAPSTLENNTHNLRDLCRFLGEKKLEVATTGELISFFNRPTRTRVGRNRRSDGTVAVKKKTVEPSRTTLGIRRISIHRFYKWLLGDDQDSL